jgi:metal-dependent hydrolase (beta-lactamase superfamily II)
MLPANGGDCFIVNSDDFYCIIDGGFVSTYTDFLKKELLTLAANSKKISLLVVTHIDNDHIGGIRKFIEENGNSQNPKIIQIENIWFNSFSQICDCKTDTKVNYAEKTILESYKIKDSISEEISIKDCISLTKHLKKGKYNCNEKAVCIENMPATNFGSIKITLISPCKSQLDNLYLYFKKELKSQKQSFNFGNNLLFADCMEAYFSDYSPTYNETKNISEKAENLSIEKLLQDKTTSDISVTNLSSIAFVMEIEHKRLLFLGDSCETQIISELKKLNITFFDVIKLSHHGSLRNAQTLFDFIDGEYFLISTDGKKHDNHPSLATLAKIVTRPTDKTRILVFNYENEGYKYFNKLEMMKQYNYEVRLLIGAEEIKV